jgi:hypothetical protein
MTLKVHALPPNFSENENTHRTGTLAVSSGIWMGQRLPTRGEI